jgi:hypothetical protein
MRLRISFSMKARVASLARVSSRAIIALVVLLAAFAPSAWSQTGAISSLYAR